MKKYWEIVAQDLEAKLHARRGSAHKTPARAQGTQMPDLVVLRAPEAWVE